MKNADPAECKRWLNNEMMTYTKLKESGRAPNRRGLLTPKENTTAFQSAAPRATVIGNVLWKPDVYETVFHKKPTPSMLSTETLDDGSVHTGVMRPDDGTP